MLRSPFFEILDKSETILLAGAGGGYDVLGAVPLYSELRARGKTVHLGSLTFTALGNLPGAEPLPDSPHLYEITADLASRDLYCPEPWLARWLSDRYTERLSVWCFEKTGVVPLEEAYRALCERLEVDTIVLIDGGIDAILRGDEASLGTPGEDLASIAAVASLPEMKTLLACLGFGAEMKEDIPHAQVLERVAALTRSEHFLGVASLLSGMPATADYRDALRFVLANQEGVGRTHIHSVIASAIDGAFGYTRPDTWVSPLSSMYWFFSLEGLVQSHLFLEQLSETRSMFEVNALIEGIRKTQRHREGTVIPL